MGGLNIKKLKVRKTRPGYQTPCAVETLSMLSCWAAYKTTSNDVGPCAEKAKALAECMRNSAKGGGNKKQSTINFHLARLQKVLK